MLYSAKVEIGWMTRVATRKSYICCIWFGVWFHEPLEISRVTSSLLFSTSQQTRISCIFSICVCPVMHAAYPLWHVSSISITRSSCWLIMLTLFGVNSELGHTAGMCCSGCISIILFTLIYINGHSGLVIQYKNLLKILVCVDIHTHTCRNTQQTHHRVLWMCG